jgi:hypothetical protein
LDFKANTDSEEFFMEVTHKIYNDSFYLILKQAGTRSLTYEIRRPCTMELLYRLCNVKCEMDWEECKMTCVTILATDWKDSEKTQTKISSFQAKTQTPDFSNMTQHI